MGRDHSAPLHAHLSEQAAENEACLAAYGRTPRRCSPTPVRSARAAPRSTPPTSPTTTYALLGGRGTGACLCPTTERDLADGIGPARPLADAGSPLSLGSDSHAVIDLFEEARAVELDERLRTAAARPLSAPPSCSTAATRAGHDALGWPDAGRARGGRARRPRDRAARTPCAPPAPARRRRPRSSPPRPPTSSHVVAGGRVVVRDGVHVALGDVGRLLADAIGALTASDLDA